MPATFKVSAAWSMMDATNSWRVSSIPIEIVMRNLSELVHILRSAPVSVERTGAGMRFQSSGHKGEIKNEAFHF
jgi:hypothetical protein